MGHAFIGGWCTLFTPTNSNKFDGWASDFFCRKNLLHGVECLNWFTSYCIAELERRGKMKVIDDSSPLTGTFTILVIVSVCSLIYSPSSEKIRKQEVGHTCILRHDSGKSHYLDVVLTLLPLSSPAKGTLRQSIKGPFTLLSHQIWNKGWRFAS